MAEAQNAWRRLFEHSPIPVLLLTPDLKIVNANESYLREVIRSRSPDCRCSRHFPTIRMRHLQMASTS
jgi:hypothetical protein